ncbi:prolyl oligopeptidase family serine peptidase [Kamptonema cortianum]|nr:prolyl oligopeptidase family serine peptidase [Kamptonema cortianum]
MPRLARAVRLFIVIIVVAATGLAQAQEFDLVPPPPISFERWRPAGGSEYAERYTITYPSALPTAYSENNSVRCEVSVPKNRIGPAPVVVLLHFWGATDSVLEQEVAEELATRGIAAISIPLPYHLSRTPDGTRSGELAIQADPEALKATMKQAISDIRRGLDFIATRPEFDSSAIGISGTSLGAIVTSLAFSVDQRFRSAAFLLGGADLAGILWNSSRVVAQRDALRRQGYTEESLREALKPVEPLTYLKPDDPRSTFVVSARHDTVIPKSATEKLIASLGEPQSLVLETGHYGGLLVRGRIVRTIAAFFSQTLRGQTFSAPSGFYSPTVRFALTGDASDGLQVAAGLDIWRSNSRADGFATLFLTPRGPRGFVGAHLGQGLSFGIVVAPKKTSAGILWSTVF